MIRNGFFGDDSVQMVEKDLPDDILQERDGWKIWGRMESTKRSVSESQTLKKKSLTCEDY